MSVVSAKHAHTPTGPFEHGSQQAQEAVASAPARDASAVPGEGAKNGSSKTNNGRHTGQASGHHTGQAKGHHTGQANGHHTDHGKTHEPTQRDIPTGESDTNVLVRERIQTAWAKFNGTTRPLLP